MAERSREGRLQAGAVTEPAVVVAVASTQGVSTETASDARRLAVARAASASQAEDCAWNFRIILLICGQNGVRHMGKRGWRGMNSNESSRGLRVELGGVIWERGYAV